MTGTRTRTWIDSPPLAAGAGLAALLLTGLAACASNTASAPPADRSRPVTASFSGFPDDSTDRSVWVEAHFLDPADPVEPMGRVDWTPEGVLAVHVEVGHLDAEWERPRLSRDTFDARLYLADGTVLGWVGPRAEGRSVVVQRAQAEQGLPFSLLPPWENAARGLVFFALPEGVRIDGETARLGGETSPREVDLDGSLLTFQVETATGSRQVRVGVRYGGTR